MIISASRRTDIPAFYSEWFMNRLEEKFVYIRNPRNPNRCSKVILNPNVVDSIVFWTKNALPILDKLDNINAMGYSYYFQFTLTPYDNHVEKRLPPKNEIIDTFKRLSDKIGPNRVIWRYDPVILNKEFSTQYHIDTYGRMCDALGDYTDRCIFSFIDLYAGIKKRAAGIIDNEVDETNMKEIALGFSEIAKAHGLSLSTCSEALDLSKYGISRAACIDKDIIENIIGCPIKAKKDPNQRPACRCIESVDIGAYDCCSHGCVYCYATTNENTVIKNMIKHDIHSSILIGQINSDDVVTEHETKSFKIMQTSMFEKCT